VSEISLMSRIEHYSETCIKVAEHSFHANLVPRVSHLTAPWSERGETVSSRSLQGAVRWETLGTRLFSPGFVPFFRNKFPGLFQDSDWFFQGSKIHINPLTPKISVLVLLTVCHTFQIFYLSLTDFQNFPGPVAFFQDFPVLVNATTKFQDFPGFPGPVQTLFHEWFSWCNSARAQGLEKTNMPSIEQFSDHFIYSTPALSVLFFSKFERSVLMALVFY